MPTNLHISFRTDKTFAFFLCLVGKKGVVQWFGVVGFLSSAKVFLLTADSVDSGFSWVGKGVAGV